MLMRRIESEKMKNIIITMMMVLTFISLTSAIFPGECDTANFPNENPVNWSVTGNSSILDGFSYTKNGTIITYCFDGSFKPDTFELTFYNTEKIVIPSSHSGSNHREEVIIEYVCENNETICDDFPSCTGKEFVQRYCITNCGEVTTDYQVCDKEFINESIDEIVIIEEEDSFGMFEIIIILLILITFIWVMYRLFLSKPEVIKE